MLISFQKLSVLILLQLLLFKPTVLQAIFRCPN